MQARMIFILITLTLDMIGIGIIIPSLPDILKKFITDPILATQSYGYFISLYAIMQFLASPLLGAISDWKGRRPVLLVSLFMAGIDYLVMAFAPTIQFLFLGRIFAGLTGANFTVAMAYIADVSDDSNRAKNFGLSGAAFGLGFIIGPAIGGWLGNMDPHYPFLVAAGMNILNFLFGFFILPESLPSEKRRKFTSSQINPFKSLSKMLSNKNLLAFFVVHFTFQLSGQTHPSIWSIYTQSKFNWNPSQIGASLAAVGFMSALTQGFLTPKVIGKFGEIKTLKVGLLGYSIGLLLFGLITQGWMVYGVLLFSSVFWTAGPALQSLISKQVPSQEQGELQGSLFSITSLASIMCPIVTTQLFAYFNNDNPIGHFSGAPYFFAFVVALIGFIIVSFKKIA
jgi:DHA1 family tetracycline resistance protein-like MFS transporter